MTNFKRNNPHLDHSVLRSDTYVNEYLINDSFSPNDNFGVNGSITPYKFTASPPANKYWMVTRILIYISDDAAFSEGQFGGLGYALTNGLQLLIDGVEIENWYTNEDVIVSMFDVKSETFLGKQDRSIQCRWTFAKAEGEPRYGFKIIDGITFNVRDNLSGLTHAHAKVQGEEFDLVIG
jgi:hypothetical protein